MTEEIDPLDAFMTTLQEETIFREKSSLESKQSLKSFQPFIDTITSSTQEQKHVHHDVLRMAAEEEEDSVSVHENVNLLNPADIIASAQKKLKKKDFLATDHSVIQYEPFKKNFLVVASDIAAMSEEQVAAYRLEMGIKVKVYF